MQRFRKILRVAGQILYEWSYLNDRILDNDVSSTMSRVQKMLECLAFPFRTVLGQSQRNWRGSLLPFFFSVTEFSPLLKYNSRCHEIVGRENSEAIAKLIV